MLQPVAVGHKTLSDYTHICGKELIEEIRELAEPLKGQRVVHISATAFGGGVSEILYTLVGLMRDVGLDCEWQVIYGREEFFNATKLMHNALQGAPQDLDAEQWETWRRYNEMNARELSGGWDVCLVHDPQPAALHTLVPEKAAGWVWRCHIDLSTPNPDTIAQLLPYISEYPQSLFHMADYVPDGMRGKVNVVPPAIDPLTPKNMALLPEDASYVCEQFGIDIDRPLMCQVSRFDPWKDPLGVIDAYRMVKERDPRHAARAGRLDGLRRPRGLGLLQRDDRPRRRRPRRAHPQQLQQRRRDRGQRLPVPRRRADPEVHARGLRADRLRGDLEGAPVHRRRRRRDPAADRGRRHRLSRLLRRAVRGADAGDPARTRRWASSSGGAARSTCARTSSRRAICGTI